MPHPTVWPSAWCSGGLATAALGALVALSACSPLPLAVPATHAGASERTSAPLSGQPVANASTACSASPFGERALYLRGTMNSWGADEKFRFNWACSRYELVAAIQGEHRYKLADEGWSADADFGGQPPDGLTQVGTDTALKPIGSALGGTFAGAQRFSVRFVAPNAPPSASSTASGTPSTSKTTALQALMSTQDCPNNGLPAGMPAGTALFLRGTMNNWTGTEDYQFQYSCDAFYLNVKLGGQLSFKIGNSTWSPELTFGASGFTTQQLPAQRITPLGRGSNPGGAQDLSFNFTGEHTLRLSFEGGTPQLHIGPKTFADPNAASVDDPLALSLKHDSRNTQHRAPFGALPAGQTIDFAVEAAAGAQNLTLVIERRELEGNQERLDYLPLARIPMRRVATASGVRFAASHRFPALGVYGYHFEADIGGKAFVYQNNGDSVYWTREKGSGGLGAVATKPARAASIRRFRVTVFDPAFKVPDWAADVVTYYVFPERFRNGNPANDPRPGTGPGAWKFQDKSIEVHKNWLDTPFRPKSGDGSDEHYSNDFFGGDLEGIIQKLDYIRDLGANAIYLTPIFQAASNHKYDHADYRSVDAGFGSNADFTRLTEEGKKRGIRIIVDASFNHTGADSIYFDRFNNHAAKTGQIGAFAGGKIRPESPYASWYSFDATQTEPDKQFKGWVGVNDLPELNKASPAWRDFAYRAPDSITRTWLQRGAAAWRMDVAPWVPDDFWREWRQVVKVTNPDALTVAETWFDASKHLLGDTFDSTMNYIFRNAVLDYAGGAKASEIYRHIELMRESYPPQAFFAQMNLLSSHDQARALHHFGYQHGPKRQISDPEPTPAEVVATAKQRLKLAVLFQMIFPGAPTIYYGDEVGVTGGDDPYNRATYPWADLGGAPDLALLSDFKRLTALRHANPVLRRGSIGAPLALTEHVIVLARELAPGAGTSAAANPAKRWALTATNNSLQVQTVRVRLPAGAPHSGWVDALAAPSADGTRAAVGWAVDGEHITLQVPPLFGLVLIAP